MPATVIPFPIRPSNVRATAVLPYRTLALGLGRAPHEYLISRTFGRSRATFVCYGWACGCRAIETGINRCRARTCARHVALLGRLAPTR